MAVYIRDDEGASYDDSILSMMSEPRATIRNGDRKLCHCMSICTYADKR